MLLRPLWILLTWWDVPPASLFIKAGNVYIPSFIVSPASVDSLDVISSFLE